jgi:hypothetical protein
LELRTDDSDDGSLSYWKPRIEAHKAAKGAERRLAEDAVFERALVKMEKL